MSVDIRNQRVKGLENLRTVAGRRADYLTKSYKIYLRVANLEMEKAHRSVEHFHVSRRKELLEQRFREIDAEKRQLFETMSARDVALKELAPAHQERIAALRRQTAAKTKSKTGALPRRQIADAEKQRRRETEAARKRGPRQPRQGFRLRY